MLFTRRPLDARAAPDGGLSRLKEDVDATKDGVIRGQRSPHRYVVYVATGRLTACDT